jgi:hypothetical protein
MPLTSKTFPGRHAGRLASLAVLSSLAAVPLVLSGCNHSGTTDTGGGNSISTTGGEAGPVATLTTPKGSTLTLTQSEFYDQLQGFVPNGSPQSFAPVGQPAGRLVIQQMLQNLIFEGLAEDQGVAPTSAEVDQQYANIKMIQEARSTKPFDQALAAAGLTPDVFKDLQVKPQLAELKLLTKGATVSDADIQAFYNANKDKAFVQPARVHLAVIVTGSLPQAQQIAKAIAGGQTFESQVAQSLDKSSPDGDVPQWLPLNNPPPAVAPLIKAVRTAAAGSVSAPVALPAPNGQTRYALVKLIQRIDKPQTLPLDQVRDLIRVQLLQQKAQSDPTAQQNFQSELRDFEGAVKITAAPQYQSVVQALTHPAPPAPASFAPPSGGAAPGGAAPAAPAPSGGSPFTPAHP